MLTGPTRLARAASTAGGGALAAAARGLAAVRPAAKPLHPAGEIFSGHLHRHGTGAPTGVGWLDEPGEDAVDVRLSRAIGLPRALPDIHGLALRVHGEHGPADVLFATTGTGRLTRFVLTFSTDPSTRPMTTLLPSPTASGPVLLAARAIDEGTYELCWARPSGAWSMFGTLRLVAPRGDDADLSFDPVLHQVPGLRQYDVVRRLREPAYLRARRSRGRA